MEHTVKAKGYLSHQYVGLTHQIFARLPLGR